MILIAPDSFKGSLTAFNAANAIKEEYESILSNQEFKIIPLADGGEGTVESFYKAIGGEILENEVTGPLPSMKVKAKWLKTKDPSNPNHPLAIIEMAAASGLPLLKEEEQNPLFTTTAGTGELIKAAWENGCKKIILGLGGSATCDGGAGAASQLGWIFKDQQGNKIEPCGNTLSQIKTIQLDKKNPINKELLEGQLILEGACDVKNPLHQEQGAAAIFAPQKGADTAGVKILKQGLLNLEKIASSQIEKIISNQTNLEPKWNSKKSFAKIKGAGAAGGLGYGILQFMNGKLVSGFNLLAKTTDLENRVKQADLIITGEGKFDKQSIMGKITGSLIELSQKHQKPVVLFCGKAELQHKNNSQLSIVEICNKKITTQKSIELAEKLLRKAAKINAQKWKTRS